MLTTNPIYKPEQVWMDHLGEFTLWVISHFLILKNLILKKFLLQMPQSAKSVYYQNA